jgi:exodeoxyribonuclease-3
MNVAPGPLDVHSPEKHLKHPCYHEDARTAYETTVKGRFVDVFRLLHPEKTQYTFWDFFANSFARDKGWRIDHIMATPEYAKKCQRVEVDLVPRKADSPSDHTVVWAEFS